MIFLDSSAVLKLVRSEEETTALIDWLERASDEPVITSELGRVEVLRASRRAGDEAVTAQARAVIAEFDLIVLDRTVHDLACDIADPPCARWTPSTWPRLWWSESTSVRSLPTTTDWPRLLATQACTWRRPAKPHEPVTGDFRVTNENSWLTAYQGIRPTGGDLPRHRGQNIVSAGRHLTAWSAPALRPAFSSAQ